MPSVIIQHSLQTIIFCQFILFSWKLGKRILCIVTKDVMGDTIGKNSQIAYFYKLCYNLSLFWKYVRIYHFFAHSSLAKSCFSWYSSSWNSSTIEKFSDKFEVHFFKKLEFLRFEFQGKFKFQKSCRSLYIFKTVVNC